MLTTVAQEDGARLRGRWFRLLYSQSFAGQPARWVVRFVRAEEVVEVALPAAALGRGAWTWRAPSDLQRLEILAPADRLGELRVDGLEPLTTATILLGILRRKPRLLLPFLWWRAPPRARHVAANEAFDLAAPEAFAPYSRARRRPFEPGGLDASLLAEAATGPRLGFVVEVSGREDLPALRRTLGAFAGQHDGLGYRLLVLAPVELAVEIRDERLGGRLEVRSPSPAARGSGGEATVASARDMGVDYVARLLPGDEPTPEAVASMRAHLAHHPDIGILYADSAGRTPGGGLTAQLKPDWSPSFQEGADYVGRPCLVRADLLDEATSWRDLPGLVATRLGARAIRHLKRVLLTLPGLPAPELRPAWPAGPASRATIVVPTRDRVDLLRRLCESLFAKTPAGSFDLVVVDNGSEDADALAYLADLEGRAEVEVLRRPGPFNFAALVNAGADAARSPILVLLNNDCEIVEPGWLRRLSAWAATPGIGAVGAKLLYADGALQHAGVALGLGGEAGHRDRKRPRDHPGNLNRLAVPHEVAAVTAACLAVRRDTFLQLGGFDEAFPVAFNDIDFCLRLLLRGERNILDTGAVLIHAESASRGRDDGPRRDRFLREAAAFRERWGDMLLDEPYLHPLLSTVRFTDRLG